jgi:hypothetical protein
MLWGWSACTPRKEGSSRSCAIAVMPSETAAGPPDARSRVRAPGKAPFLPPRSERPTRCPADPHVMTGTEP